MKRWLTGFVLFAMISSYGQTVSGEPSDVQLLKYAYGAASSLPPDRRLGVLAELVSLASQSRVREAVAWTDELERLAKELPDNQRMA